MSRAAEVCGVGTRGSGGVDEAGAKKVMTGVKGLYCGVMEVCGGGGGGGGEGQQNYYLDF